MCMWRVRVEVKAARLLPRVGEGRERDARRVAVDGVRVVRRDVQQLARPQRHAAHRRDRRATVRRQRRQRLPASSRRARRARRARRRRHIAIRPDSHRDAAAVARLRLGRHQDHLRLPMRDVRGRVEVEVRQRLGRPEQHVLDAGDLFAREKKKQSRMCCAPSVSWWCSA